MSRSTSFGQIWWGYYRLLRLTIQQHCTKWRYRQKPDHIPLCTGFFTIREVCYNAGMIRVGTCSWTEKTLIKSREFYPGEARTAEDRLRFYAGHFDVVEVDSTYYGIPSMQTVALWADRTPADFIFHIKAYAGLTGHGVDPRSLPQDMRGLLKNNQGDGRYAYIKDPSMVQAVAERFLFNLQPLIVSGKLGVIVFQFPPWFHYGHRNLEFIVTCKKLMKDLRLAVEFRHGTWLAPGRRESVTNFLREHGLIYVVADEPQFGDETTIPYFPEITSDVAYFRFHGRNSENWLKKGIETALRYAYVYTEEELKAFVPSIQKVDERARTTHVMFNNCYMASAIKNALRMKDLIRQKGSSDSSV